ncbi:MAG: beta strand repeat-containing protein [Anaerolineae bacterium]
MKRVSVLASFIVVLAFILALSVLSLSGSVLQNVRAAGPWYVSTAGSDSNSCTSLVEACRTISKTVSIASSGDEIVIAAGTYSENVIVNKELSFTGAGVDSTFVDGGNLGRVFSTTITNTTFSNLTIQNGRAVSGSGGGIAAAGALTLSNVNILSNTAFADADVTRGGGGVRVWYTLTVTGGRFANNVVSGNGEGGAIRGNPPSGTIRYNASISGTMFISNTSGGSGGAVSLNGPTWITNSDFYTNTSLNTMSIGGGGGAWIYNTLVLTGGYFVNNRAVSQGGAAGTTSTVTVTGTQFISNSSTLGGGLYCIGTVIINGAQFTRNNASGNGGGINAERTITVTDAEFYSNTGTLGGGLYGLSEVMVTGGQFISNTARESGGGYYANGATTITGGYILSNTAAVYGGGLYGNNTVVITGTEIISNIAGYGGGLYGFEAVTVTASSFRNNTAYSSTVDAGGGGIYAYRALSVTSTQFIRNSAANGGGAYVFARSASGTSRLVNVLLDANRAQSGAALYLFNSGANGKGGTAIIIHATIVSPTVGSGQAIYIGKPTNPVTVLIHNSIIASYTVGIGQAVGAVVTSDYNLFFHAPTAIITGAHSITATDPLFVNPSGGDYHLMSTSPAIDKGKYTGVVLDLDGNSRPYLLGYDMGAYEYPYIRAFSLSVGKAGTGAGSIASDPAAISCGITCTASFGIGTAVTLTATPLISSTFDNWSGACSGTGNCSVTMTETKSVTATFTVITYRITATAGINGSITPSGTQHIDYGTSRTYNIAANDGYHILDVKIDGESIGITTTFTFVNVTSNHTITASFGANTYTLSIYQEGTGNGTIETNPPGGVYAYGTVITLTATPRFSSYFAGWSGDVVTTTNPLTMTVNADTELTATFSVIETFLPMVRK